jgi:hypothetical protein
MATVDAKKRAAETSRMKNLPGSRGFEASLGTDVITKPGRITIL